jgi:hypothetical protein
VLKEEDLFGSDGVPDLRLGSERARQYLEACLHCCSVCTWFGTTARSTPDAVAADLQHVRLISLCADVCAAAASHLMARSPAARSWCEGCASLCAQCAHAGLCSPSGRLCALACADCVSACHSYLSEPG